MKKLLFHFTYSTIAIIALFFCGASIVHADTYGYYRNGSLVVVSTVNIDPAPHTYPSDGAFQASGSITSYSSKSELVNLKAENNNGTSTVLISDQTINPGGTINPQSVNFIAPTAAGNYAVTFSMGVDETLGTGTGQGSVAEWQNLGPNGIFGNNAGVGGGSVSGFGFTYSACLASPALKDENFIMYWTGSNGVRYNGSGTINASDLCTAPWAYTAKGPSTGTAGFSTDICIIPLTSGIQPAPGQECPPVISFEANPSAVQYGNDTMLTWSTLGNTATSCTSNDFQTNGATSGSVPVTVWSNSTYSITCTGPKGSDSESTNVYIDVGP